MTQPFCSQVFTQEKRKHISMQNLVHISLYNGFISNSQKVSRINTNVDQQVNGQIALHPYMEYYLAIRNELQIHITQINLQITKMSERKREHLLCVSTYIKMEKKQINSKWQKVAWDDGGNMTGRITREYEETFGVIVKFIFLTVVMISQAKIFKFHTLYICSLLYVIYTPIKLFKLIYIVYNYMLIILHKLQIAKCTYSVK